MTMESAEDKKEQTSEATSEKVSTKTEEVSTPMEEVIAERIKAERSKWQSEKDKELKTLYSERDDLRKKASEAELAVREKAELSALGEAPDEAVVKELRDVQEKRRKLTEKENELEAKRQQLAGVEEYVSLEAKGIFAHKLAQKYGVEEKEILDAKSPEEMELQALKLSHQRLETQLKEKPPQKIDSSTHSAAGEDWRKLSPEEMIKRGYTQK